MAVPEMHPQSLVLRRRSHDRQHVGHAGANAAPGFGLDRSAEIDQPPRRLLGAIELARLRQPFRSHQFGAGRNPQSLRHRRHGVGELRIVQRQIEPAAAAEMPVVATLAKHRKTIVEFLQEIGRPWTQRHHGRLGSDRAIIRLNRPAGSRRRQCGRIAVDEGAAVACEQVGIGGDEPARVRDRPGVAPVNSPRPGLVEPGLGRGKLCRADDFRSHAEFGRQRLGDRRHFIQCCLGAAQGMIAASLHQIISASFPDQHVMLARRLCDEPRVSLRNAVVPIRRGMPPVPQQGTKMPRQPTDAVMDIVGAPCRDRR